jgi:hypothetical protein
MSDNQIEVQRQFRNQQEKYVYYVLALSVSALAFAISKTSGVAIKYTHIPLGIAVLCWGISLFCGFKFIEFTLSSLYANNLYFDVLADRVPETKNDPDLKTILAEGTKNIVKSEGNIAKKYFSWQKRLFLLGILLYLIWHILEMYMLRV